MFVKWNQGFDVSYCPTFIHLSVLSWHGDLSQKKVKKKKKEEELNF
jgi:hypothetical protein